MNESRYFNKFSVVNIALMTALYLFIDIALIDYVHDVNAYSKGFYSKFLFVIIYGFISNEKALAIAGKQQKVGDAPFHYSILVLCLWFGGVTAFDDDITLSSYAGIFLIVGGFSAFYLIDEILKQLSDSGWGAKNFMFILEMILKLIMFSIFLSGLYIIALGEWVWEIKQFYDWGWSI